MCSIPKLGLRLSSCLSVLEWMWFIQRSRRAAVNRWQTADAMKKRVLQKTTALAFLDLSSTLLHLLAVALITFEIGLRRDRIRQKKRTLSGIRMISLNFFTMY